MRKYSLPLPPLQHLSNETWSSLVGRCACRQYLPQSTYVLYQLGYNQYLNGDYGQALHSLQRAQQIDPLLLKHMDILAFLSYTECKDNSLEK